MPRCSTLENRFFHAGGGLQHACSSRPHAYTLLHVSCTLSCSGGACRLRFGAELVCSHVFAVLVVDHRVGLSERPTDAAFLEYSCWLTLWTTFAPRSLSLCAFFSVVCLLELLRRAFCAPRLHCFSRLHAPALIHCSRCRRVCTGPVRRRHRRPHRGEYPIWRPPDPVSVDRSVAGLGVYLG